MSHPQRFLLCLMFLLKHLTPRKIVIQHVISAHHPCQRLSAEHVRGGACRGARSFLQCRRCAALYTHCHYTPRQPPHRLPLCTFGAHVFASSIECARFHNCHMAAAKAPATVCVCVLLWVYPRVHVTCKVEREHFFYPLTVSHVCNE